MSTRKSYIFITRISQISGNGRTLGSFISEEVYNEDEFNDSPLPSIKKIEDLARIM